MKNLKCTEIARGSGVSVWCRRACERETERQIRVEVVERTSKHSPGEKDA